MILLNDNSLLCLMLLLARCLAFLPFWLLYRVADLLALVAFYGLCYRKAVVLENLRRSFPDKTAIEIKRLARQSFRNLADLIVEIVKSPRLSESVLKRRVIFKNPEMVQYFLDHRQSLLFLAAHQCNWEWLLMASCLQFTLPTDAIYKPLHNKAVNQFMYQLRSRFGATLIPAKKTIMSTAKHYKEQRIVAMICDQAPLQEEEQHWETCLNQETAFLVGPQKIANFTQYPVVFVGMKRLKRGYYEINFEMLAKPPYSKKSYHIVEAYARAFERQVLHSPADWLWTNRRWKREKPLSNNHSNEL